MDELDLLRELRADVASPPIAGARHRLIEAARLRPGGRVRSYRRLVLGLAAAAVAAALAGLEIGGRAPDAAGPGAYTLAAHVLNAGAARLGREPSHRPAPDQWIYSVVAQAGPGTTDSIEPPSWMTFDGSGTAYLFRGRLIVRHDPSAQARGRTPMARWLNTATPMTAYDALAALPQHPRATLDAIARVVVAHPNAAAAPGSSPPSHATLPQREFGFLTTLLWNAAQAAPAHAVAATYHALALIPGVRAVWTRDAVHRPAIALADRGDAQQLLLDPRSYRVTGLRTVSDGRWPKNPDRRTSATYPRGTVITSLAWSQIAFVPRAGLR